MKESMRLVSAAASGFWQVLSDLMHVPMARCTIMLYMPTQNLSYTRVCVFVCVCVLVRVCQAALSTREVGEGEEPPAEIRKEAEAQRSVERGRQCAGLRWGGGGRTLRVYAASFRSSDTRYQPKASTSSRYCR